MAPIALGKEKGWDEAASTICQDTGLLSLLSVEPVYVGYH
jgi:hypothetical protein